MWRRGDGCGKHGSGGVDPDNGRDVGGVWLSPPCAAERAQGLRKDGHVLREKGIFSIMFNTMFE